MSQAQMETVVPERQFVGLLEARAENFFRLSNALTQRGNDGWNNRHFFQLISEADNLENFLDDYGARLNRTFAPFTALIASLRWFGKAGYSLSHHLGRLASYGVSEWLPEDELKDALRDTYGAASFVRETAVRFLHEVCEEGRTLGLDVSTECMSDSKFPPVSVRVQLPRNVGQVQPQHEQQKIAEVASTYLKTCEMFSELGIRPIEDSAQRAAYLDRWFTEEKSRVYQAEVHNLQSAYDTYIRNTVLEGRDDHLPRLRGHCSAALHLLEAVTQLTHFIERHHGDDRCRESRARIRALVDRRDIQAIILNQLLVWANRHLQEGARLASSLLPAYTRQGKLEVQLPENVSLHARPVALIVGIVSHHGIPVEMEVGGESASAASILKLLMVIGSHPQENSFSFRGEERALHDIRLLFESGLGEQGLDTLPSALDYLRS